MAKKSYKINSEIININNEAVNDFPTVKAAKEFIAEMVENEAIDLSKDTALGTIDGYAKDEQINTTPIRCEKGKVKFGRTAKIESEMEFVFTPSAKLNEAVNGTETEDEIEEESPVAEEENEIEEATETTVEDAE